MTEPMTVGSLFAGIGGIELGLEWTGGFRTVWQVERNPYCLSVLAKHWPNATRFDDVHCVGAHNLQPVDVICGGFPCQDVSLAKQDAEGLDGERSGLWREYARIVRELRPRYVLVENVAALRFRGLGVVLGQLAEIGYDAEWSTVSACAVGAPHPRERVFVLAYPNGERLPRRENGSGGSESGARAAQQLPGLLPPSAWAHVPEPCLDGVAHGLPGRVERTIAIGNSVAPKVAEAAGRLILSRELQQRTEAA